MKIAQDNDSSNNCSTPKSSRFSLLSSTFNWSASGSDSEKDTSVFYSTIFTAEMQATVELARDYVACRLQRCGFISKVYVTALSPPKDQILRHRIIAAGENITSFLVIKSLQYFIICNFYLLMESRKNFPVLQEQ